MTLFFKYSKYYMMSSAVCLTLFDFVLQGKFIRINFDVNGYIVGANIETCILCTKFFSTLLIKLDYPARWPSAPHNPPTSWDMTQTITVDNNELIIINNLT